MAGTKHFSRINYPVLTGIRELLSHHSLPNDAALRIARIERYLVQYPCKVADNPLEYLTEKEKVEYSGILNNWNEVWKRAHSIGATIHSAGTVQLFIVPSSRSAGAPGRVNSSTLPGAPLQILS
jgi:hypothetical protein